MYSMLAWLSGQDGTSGSARTLHCDAPGVETTGIHIFERLRNVMDSAFRLLYQAIKTYNFVLFLPCFLRHSSTGLNCMLR